MKPSAEYIGRNGNFAEAKIWQSWMEETAKAAKKLRGLNRDTDGGLVDPFSYNEAASVSHLVTGAAKAGMVSLAEYVTKKASKDKRFKDKNGRTDFWLCDANDNHWEFEFKQWFVKMSYEEKIEAMIKSSRKDAEKLLGRRQRIKDRENSIVAGAIFPTLTLAPNKIVKFDEHIRAICSTKDLDELQEVPWVRHGWKISPGPGVLPTYLIFDVLSAR